jgi:hypothetical protein
MSFYFWPPRVCLVFRLPRVFPYTVDSTNLDACSLCHFQLLYRKVSFHSEWTIRCVSASQEKSQH